MGSHDCFYIQNPTLIKLQLISCLISGYFLSPNYNFQYPDINIPMAKHGLIVCLLIELNYLLSSISNKISLSWLQYNEKRYKNFLQHRLLSSIKNIFNIMCRKGTSVKSNSFGRQQSSPFPCIAIASTTPTSTTSLSTSSPFSVADNSVNQLPLNLSSPVVTDPHQLSPSTSRRLRLVVQPLSRELSLSSNEL